jgi:hypothetical protein
MHMRPNVYLGGNLRKSVRLQVWPAVAKRMVRCRLVFGHVGCRLLEPLIFGGIIAAEVGGKGMMHVVLLTQAILGGGWNFSRGSNAAQLQPEQHHDQPQPNRGAQGCSLEVCTLLTMYCSPTCCRLIQMDSLPSADGPAAGCLRRVPAGHVQCSCRSGELFCANSPVACQSVQ